jgi:hypothetical protein
MTKNSDVGRHKFESLNTRTIKKTDSIVDSIIDQFVERAAFGKAKYNTDLDREDLSILEWIEHAKQEHMDAILYLEKLRTIVETKGL